MQLTRKKHIDIPFEYAPDSFRKIVIKDFERHKDRVPGLKPWLKSLPNKHREEVVDYLVKETDDVPVPEGKMMSWDNIRELKQQGFIIGSHSHTHPMLANLASDDDIRYELQTSAERIMKEAGHQAETISYPIGSFDNRVTRIASECGYKWGLAVKQRFFDYGKDDTMAIPRLELYEEPWLKVQMRRFGLISKLRAVWS